MGAAAADEMAAGTGPQNAGWVLAALILAAAVANLNLSVANVALPDIGKHFDSSQTMLDVIAVGYSLGLACSVLWLCALGDRYGRKAMQGDNWSYVAGIIAVVLGAMLVFFKFPRREAEQRLLAEHDAENRTGLDAAGAEATSPHVAPA